MKAKTKQKQSLWRARIEEWRGSGLSQSRYCRERGISLATFGYWKRCLAEKSEERFVRFKPQAPRRKRKRLCLILPDGMKLVFKEQTPLASVNLVLEKLCGSTGIR
jgi:hypothetical protein